MEDGFWYQVTRVCRLLRAIRWGILGVSIDYVRRVNEMLKSSQARNSPVNELLKNFQARDYP